MLWPFASGPLPVRATGVHATAVPAHQVVTPFIFGGGPIIPGRVWPFVCITIACGAISGFHALISSGTTPKMLTNEKDMRMIGYGAMRFIAELAREPDSFLGFLALGLTMGQWLSLPMVAAGVVMMVWAYARAGKSQPTLIDRLK